MFGPSTWVGISVLSSVRTTALWLLDPVFTMVRAAPTLRWKHLEPWFASARLPGSSRASAPANDSISRSGGAGQGRRSPASFASEPLTVRRHGGYPRSDHRLRSQVATTACPASHRTGLFVRGLLLSYLVRCR